MLSYTSHRGSDRVIAAREKAEEAGESRGAASFEKVALVGSGASDPG